MSAYVVDRNHIRYLVEAARRPAAGNHDRVFCYSYGSPGNYQRGEVSPYDRDALDRAGTMLWEANIHSVLYRYQDDTRQTMPGPIGEDYTYRHVPVDHSMYGDLFHPGHVFAACDCYEYQSCEDSVAWPSSEAQGFINGLREKAQKAVSAVVDAKWGAPELLDPAISSRRNGALFAGRFEYAQA